MKKLQLIERLKSSAWPTWGFAWRFLLFLLALCGLIFLLHTLVDSCERRELQEQYDDDDIISPRERFRAPFDDDDDGDDDRDERRSRPDTTAVFPIKPRPDVPELPDSVHNRLPKPDPDDFEPSPDRDRYYLPGLINIILEKGDENTLANFARRFKQEYPDDAYQIVYYDDLTYLIKIRVPRDQHDRVVRELPQKLSDFDFVVFDEELFDANVRPTDPKFRVDNCSWYFKAIQAYEAWDVTMGSPSVTVAVVDAYFDVNHDELRDQVVKPFNVWRRSRDVSPHEGVFMEDVSHGTHVAATIAGAAGNGHGVSGIAPGCRLMPVGVFVDGVLMNGQHISTSSLKAQGILYAIYQGADVVNISMGSTVADTDYLAQLTPEQQKEVISRLPRYSEKVWDFITKVADKRGCILVWSAGNSNLVSGFDSSKRNEHTLRVSAVGRDLKKAEFSNYGCDNGGADYSTVSAPGVDIYNAGHANRYIVMQGTSMAAPIVSGAVALLKSIDPTLKADEVIEILRSTGKPVGDGCGPLIQLRKAVDAVNDRLFHYDRARSNPNYVVGTWSVTSPVYSSHDGHPLFVRLTFNTPRDGTIVIDDQVTGVSYSAPVVLSYHDDHIAIDQQSPATGSDGREYVEDHYYGTPDDNRHMYCVVRNGDATYECYLRRMK